MHSFVIALILLLVAFGIVFYWNYNSGSLIDNEAAVNLCRATLAVQKKTAANGWLIDSNSPLASSCKRRIITVSENKVTVKKIGKLAIEHPLPVYVPEDSSATPASGSNLGGEPLPKRMTKISKVDEPVIASVFAESMRRCWTMGLEGDVKIMDAETDFARSNVCVLCDEIHVKRGKPTPIEGTDKINWLQTYLDTEAMPSSINAAKPVTYASFLDRYPGEDNNFPNVLGCDEQISLRNFEVTDGTYATILIRRFSDWSDDGWVVSHIGGKSCMTTAVVSASALRRVCNYVAN